MLYSTPALSALFMDIFASILPTARLPAFGQLAEYRFLLFLYIHHFLNK